MAMNNTQSWFADKAKASTGFYDADGSPARGYPRPMGMETAGPTTTAPKAVPTLASRAEGLGRSIGGTASKGLTAAKGVGLPGVLGAAGVAAQGLAMDSDGQRSAFYDDPSVGVGSKLRQGARDVIALGAPAAAGVVGGVAGSAAGPVGAIAGGMLGSGAGFYVNNAAQGVFNGVDKVTGGTGQSPLDDYKKAKGGLPSADKGKPLDVIAPGDPRYEQLMATPHGGIVGQDEYPSVKTAKTTFGTPGNPDLFTRGATPEAELARQTQAGARFEPDLNAALAERVKANGGKSTFRDAAAQALFNIKQGVTGSGIKVTDDNGTPTFSGNNIDGSSGPLYRAADGSMTTDWSKTQQYAEAIQRNAKDQDRLAELTRGAALTGDREALARLTKGDARLEGLAKEAGTEKRLRDAAGNGSVNAMHLLSEMEKTKSDGAYKAADLRLRGAALVGAQEDRNLNRQLREDQMRIGLANAKYTREKDARDTETEAEKRTNSMVKDISVTDGKFNPDLYQQNLTAASRLKRGRGEGDASYNTDVMETANLQRSLGDSQWLIDRMTSSPQGAQPDTWKVNKGLRGGYVTDDGKHIANWQLDRMPPEMKRRFLNDFVAKD